jgi:enoyl-CoA hydratase
MSSSSESAVLLPTFETLLLDQDPAEDGAVATLTIHRPSVLNALNAQLFHDLEQAFGIVSRDPSVRVILLTGAGEKAFAAGADINELAQTDADSGERLALRGQAVFAQIAASSKPVIACINGFALGGGLELALACQLRVASDQARLGQPEIKLGLLPGYGGTQRLPRLVGAANALRLLLTGDMIPAAEALRIGLVDEVVPSAELMRTAHSLAARIAAQAPLAVAAILEVLREGADLPLDQALALEAKHFGRLSGSADKREGVEAFLAKRPAMFTGR